ncbi:pirin [Spirosoma sp. KNUC1025]|uniref:pirin family protein n=1 Tax=Spirosoma sp. KNUC1025 TaxID=2894082 RepID=UPI00386D081D|nr:pirin [Spirosoma sp. KNUC1025]
MDIQTQAQIYLADQRGRSQLDTLQSFHSFNFGAYSDDSRRPFGALQLLNDDFLKAGASIGLEVERNTDILLIPLVGGLEYQSPVGNGFVEPGQAQLISLRAGMAYQVMNPYETELINCVTIWLTNDSDNFVPKAELRAFNLETKNQLLPFYQSNADMSAPCGWIGRYDGRQEGLYRLTEKARAEQGVFVFVLSGAFEVQNRLLHERDGLALLNIQYDEVDFEALSNEAVLILLTV